MPNYPTTYRPGSMKYLPPPPAFSKGELVPLPPPIEAPPAGGYEYGETGAGYADWGNMPGSGGNKSNSTGPGSAKMLGGTGLSRGLIGAGNLLGTVYSSITLGELSRVAAKHAADPALQLLQRNTGNVRFTVPANWTQHCGPVYPGPPTAFKNYNGDDFWHASTTHAGTDASMSTLRTSTCPPASLNAAYARDNTVAALTNFGFCIAHFNRTGAIGDVPRAWYQHTTYQYQDITYRKSATVERTIAALAPIAGVVTAIPGATFKPADTWSPDVDKGYDPPGGDWPPPVEEYDYGSTPPRRTKEKKSKARSPLGRALARRATRAFGSMTEACDVVEALYEALPDGKDERGPNAQIPVFRKDAEGRWIAPGCKGKAVHLYNNWDKIDWETAADNLIVNELEDQAIGRTARKSADNLRDAGWSFAGGAGFGPAL